MADLKCLNYLDFTFEPTPKSYYFENLYFINCRIICKATMKKCAEAWEEILLNVSSFRHLNAT